MTKAEWFKEKHPDPDEDQKYIKVADEAYDAGYEAAKVIAKHPVEKSREAVESALKIYSMILNPCPECRNKDRKNAKELETCLKCCYYYESKFQM